MQDKYLQVFISAENKENAKEIRSALMNKKLIPGGPILQGPAEFWWKGEVVDMDYCYIFAYTKENLKEQILETAKKVSIEDLPMITFTEFQANQDLYDWIDKTLE